MARFTLLGPVGAEIGDQLVRLPPKERIVLATLLLRAGKVVPGEALAQALWDAAPPASARNTIQGHVKRLRRLLEPESARIVTVAPGYLIEVSPDELDLCRFTELRSRADAAVRAGSWENAGRLLREALALWQGEPLSDVPSAYLRRTEVQRLSESRFEALEARLDVDLRAGRHDAVIMELRGLVGEHPFRERLRERLMLALYRGQRQSEALAAYADARRTLRTELGIDPNPELQRLHEQILAADPALETPYRQPPARPVPRQLPADLNDFAGRSSEVSRLCEALANRAVGSPGSTAIAAITGPGGIGKTALAVHTAHLSADGFPDGQLYVELAGTSADPAVPADVLARLLRDLDVPAEDVPGTADERAARYRSLLAGRRMLVVLDDAKNAAQVRPLLPGSAGCGVLVTSRARLADLDGLRLVDLPELEPDEGRGLFAGIVGAGRAAAEPEATERIIRSCAGLPLAIRIAASRLTARPGWSIEDMAGKLAAEQDRLTELRSGDMAIRACFMLSHSCLTPGQARAFSLLGLAPAGTFELAAAAALVGLGPAAAEAVLDELTDAHMLESPHPDRYKLHELLRLFATELAAAELSDADREHASRRLIEWYAAAIRSASRTLAPDSRTPRGVDDGIAAAAAHVPVFGTHPDALSWCQLHEPALVWAIRTAAGHWPELTVMMAAYMWAYYVIAGNPETFESTQRLGLASARELGNELAVATLQGGRGGALVQSGDYAQAVECFREVLAIRRAHGDQAGELRASSNLAIAYQHQGRYAESLQESDKTSAIAEQLGDTGLLGILLNNSADTCQLMGDLEGALTRYSEAVRLLVESQDRHTEGMARTGLGETLRLLGRLDESLAQHRLAVAILNELGTEHREQIGALHRLGATLADLGQADAARQSWTEALQLAESTSDARAAELRMLAESASQARA